MQCPACGHDNRDQAQFCEDCGSRLEKKCTQCGNAVREGARFCDNCGTALESPSPAAEVSSHSPLGARAEELTRRLSTYTPKHLVDKVLTSRSAIEGERRQVTVLFADVCNFTGISESLDPEEVHRLMDDCFEILIKEIHRFEGTINQFTGDGVMALFGAPIAHEDAAQRAVRAGLSVQTALAEYSESVRHRHGVTFQMRIGINTGTVVVGKIGDDLRMDYTAAGDSTNLAARLQSVADPGTVLVSEQTYRLTKDFVEFTHQGFTTLKGKSSPTTLYRALRAKPVNSRLDVALSRGLTSLVARNAEIDHLMAAFAKAKDGHGQIISLVGDAGVGKSRLAHEFKERIQGEDITLWEAHCPSHGQAIPYLPVAQVVKSYCDIKEGDQESKIREKVGQA